MWWLVFQAWRLLFHFLLVFNPTNEVSVWFLVAESRRASVDIFLRAAGYLDCAVRHVLPQLSAELRSIWVKDFR